VTSQRDHAPQGIKAADQLFYTGQALGSLYLGGVHNLSSICKLSGEAL